MKPAIINIKSDAILADGTLIKISKDKRWVYTDLIDKRIRIISVDACDINESPYGYISNAQLDWIANVALNFDGKASKDWGVVFALERIFEDTDYHENTFEVLCKICIAFNKQQEYAVYYKHNENPIYDLNLSADFTRYAKVKKRPHTICMLIHHGNSRGCFVKKGINMISPSFDNDYTISIDTEKRVIYAPEKASLEY